MSTVQLHLGDCLEFMRGMDAGSVDAVVTDPPYGIAYCHGLRRGGLRYGTDGMSIVGDEQPFDPSPWLDFPIVILWGANHFASRLPDSSCWLVWDKRDGISSNDQSDCEMAWTNQSGVARLRTRYWNGAHAREKDAKRSHPNQKPVELMKWCMDVVGIPKGATVFDPFMGSGTTGVACVQTGRNFIGCEIDPGYFEIAKRRIAAAQAQPPLIPHTSEPQPEQIGLPL